MNFPLFQEDTIYQDGVVFAPKDSSRYTSTRELLGHGSQHDLNMDKFTGAEEDEEDGGDQDFIWDQTNDESRDLDSGLVSAVNKFYIIMPRLV